MRRGAASLLLLAAAAGLLLAAHVALMRALHRDLLGLAAASRAVGITLASDGIESGSTSPVRLAIRRIEARRTGLFTIVSGPASLRRPLGGFASDTLAEDRVAGTFADGAGPASIRLRARRLEVSWSATRLVLVATAVRREGPAETIGKVSLAIDCRAGSDDLHARLLVSGVVSDRDPTAHSAPGATALLDVRAAGRDRIAWTLDVRPRPRSVQLVASGTLAAAGADVAPAWVGTAAFGPGWPEAVRRLRAAGWLADPESRTVAGMLAFLADPSGRIVLPVRVGSGGLSIGTFRLADAAVFTSVPPPASFGARARGPMSLCGATRSTP